LIISTAGKNAKKKYALSWKKCKKKYGFRKKPSLSKSLMDNKFYRHTDPFYFVLYCTSIPSNMSETFPEHSNERCSVVGCLSDITVFPKECVVSLYNTSEAVKRGCNS